MFKKYASVFYVGYSASSPIILKDKLIIRYISKSLVSRSLSFHLVLMIKDQWNAPSMNLLIHLAQLTFVSIHKNNYFLW